MSFDPISAIFGVADTVIKRVFPDPEQQAKATLELAKLQQEGNHKELDAQVALLTGQMEINKVEAAHGGNFKGGWRPMVGWICAAAMGYKFVLFPFIISIVQITAHFTGAKLFPIEMLPVIEWSELSVILLGMLGIGTLRTYEKRKTANG